MSTDARTVLVTGATGTVGSGVVSALVEHGVSVRALTRSPDRATLPPGAEAVAGELTDPGSVSRALDGVDGLFLLSPVSADELTGTLLSLDLARNAGTEALVYLSVIHADRFTDPPHFAAKAAAERMIAEYDLPATILRPGYYMQNDADERERLLDGVYAPPLGDAGVLAIDVRDLSEVAAAAMLERLERSGAAGPETIDVVTPQPITGSSAAQTWAGVLDRAVSYGGDDLDAFEQAMQGFAPGWMARDMRLMMMRFQRDGMTAAPGTDERLQALLGRSPRSYAAFVEETAAGW